MSWESPHALCGGVWIPIWIENCFWGNLERILYSVKIPIHRVDHFHNVRPRTFEWLWIRTRGNARVWRGKCGKDNINFISIHFQAHWHTTWLWYILSWVIKWLPRAITRYSLIILPGSLNDYIEKSVEESSCMNCVNIFPDLHVAGIYSRPYLIDREGPISDVRITDDIVRYVNWCFERAMIDKSRHKIH